jgi:membrane protein implicated in regulation of membrane protease activity
MVQYTILEIEAIAVSAVFCIAILTWDMILTAILYAVACALTPLSFTIQGVIYSIALVKCIEIMYRTAKKNRIKVLSVENTDADIFDTEIADEFDKLNQKL